MARGGAGGRIGYQLSVIRKAIKLERSENGAAGMRATWTVKPARQRVSYWERANQWRMVGIIDSQFWLMATHAMPNLENFERGLAFKHSIVNSVRAEGK